MNQSKYELITSDFPGFYRVKALRDFGGIKAGDIGGYVQSKDNLSITGDCWVYHNAVVYGNAKIYGNALVYDKAEVYDNAKIYDNAQVYNNARVHGNARVYSNALISRGDTTTCLYFQQYKHGITVTNSTIQINCEAHSWEHWEKHIQDIGLSNGYSEEEIEETRLLLKVAKAQITRQLQRS